VAKQAVNVEFFFAGGCENCARVREALREVAQLTAQVQWSEIDIGKHPHRAVDVGVVSTPAVAIDGRLVFKSVPSPAELRSALAARLSGG
jgi:thioredoxin 1